MQNRLAEIDNAKALGILLVVVGHVLSPSYYLTNLIFSFHVPLFFFLSGYLLSARKLESGLTAFTTHAARRLLMPYVAFGLMLYIPWVLVFRHFGSGVGVPWYKPLLGVAYGIGHDGWLQQSSPLWFLPALFLAMVLTYGVCRQKSSLQWPLAVLGASLGLLASLSPVTFPWGIMNALFALPFMLAGVHWRRGGYPLHPHGIWSYVAPIVGAGALLILVYLNGHTDFNHMMLGNLGPLVYVPAAAIGIALSLHLSAIIPASRVAQVISTATLFILALHIPLFTLIKGASLKILHIPTDTWSTNPALIILITIIATTISVAAHYGLYWGWEKLLNRQRR